MDWVETTQNSSFNVLWVFLFRYRNSIHWIREVKLFGLNGIPTINSYLMPKECSEQINWNYINLNVKIVSIWAYTYISS